MLTERTVTQQQVDMLAMESNRIPFPLFNAGYGAGKSDVLVLAVIRDAQLFNGVKIGVYAPTYDLLNLNLVPRIEQELDFWGVKHSMNKSTHMMRLQGNASIIFRSMDNPSRIVAYEVYRSHVDEADLMNTARKGEESWNRIIARNRQRHPDRSKHFNMVSAYSTPESFKFTYKRWKKEPGKGYKYVTAPTRSNPFLPESFIANLEDTYTPQQCKAYLEGIWTNIFTGSVYSYFDRDKHSTSRRIKKNDVLHIGQDFNYGGSCGAVYVKYTKYDKLMSDTALMEAFEEECNANRKKLSVALTMAKQEDIGLVMVDEYAAQDTEQIVETVKERYSGHRIVFYPDASGRSNATNASASDISMLTSAGYEVKAKRSNPRIADRINSVQRLLYNNRYFINPVTCPKTIEAMEEHAFSDITGLPEKFTGPATVDDRMDSAGYCPAYLHPIKKAVTTRMELF